ncbi:aryl-alcohol dehydrogenase-like predicted oxidoreductase [Shimia isoporae]|uniref:Aryl-alcohol dehydrogenase-like predicted oxidoreductase n=1 Tax=Shimia isoporae TaxID=647720 RepID=A0A4R1N8D2_9RHOB|nr:aldo/keto reductase [Shimia isoporae]TCK99800.1 aryl-alcohol dehydrogenase-like predicted oxidoreductase [Shimia isoporae]
MTDMKYTRLGNSGLVVSRMSLGTMTFTHGSDWIPGVAKVDLQHAQQMVDLALDRGVNFFDSADGYSNGEAEDILGKALKGKRDQAVICTKLGFRQSDRITDAGLSRSHIIASVEGSLRRFGTEWIDLLVLHKTDFTTPLQETLSTLQNLIDAGKIRQIGVSNWPAWQLARAIQFQRDNGMQQFIAGQYLYNAVGRDIEVDVLKLGKEMGVGLMAWSPLAGGLLTGKYDPADLEKGEGRLTEGNFLQVSPEQATATLNALNAAAEEHSATTAQIAQAWILNKRRDHTVILGASKISQLESGIAAANISLSEAEMDSINAAAAPARRYPEWFDDMMTDEQFTKALS